MVNNTCWRLVYENERVNVLRANFALIKLNVEVESAVV